MVYTNDASSNIFDILNSQYKALKSQRSLNSPYIPPASLIGRKTENRLLNTQARIEYELLKTTLLTGVAEANKLLGLDDQIMAQEYKLCTSLTYRRQIFVMEFRQLPTDSKMYNHVLDFIFQGSDRISSAAGHHKLVLVRENNKFVWCQINADTGGLSGSSRVIANIVLRWLRDEKSLFMRFAPTL